MKTYVTRKLLIVLLVAASTACASTGHKQQVVLGYQGAQMALGSFQDAEISLYNAKTIPSLTEEKHVAVHKLLSTAFAIQDQVGNALLIWKSGQPVPTSVDAWQAEGQRVLGELQKLFPDNEQVRLVNLLIPWIRAIVDTVKLLGAQPLPSLVSVATGGAQ